MLAQRFKVTGVDLSRRQIELAREFVPEATFLQGDMGDVSSPDETFDAIYSLYAIFHVPREEHEALFRRVHRMLEAGGLAISPLVITAGGGAAVAAVAAVAALLFLRRKEKRKGEG